jgi:hypothetical protein
MVDSCCMCKRNGESVNHILLHCEVVVALWDAFFSRFGLSWGGCCSNEPLGAYGVSPWKNIIGVGEVL